MGFPFSEITKSRLVNLSGQILVKNANKTTLLPKEFDWGTDFFNGLSIVVKNKKKGVIDDSGHEIIPIGKYQYIDIMYNGLIKISSTSYEIEEKDDLYSKKIVYYTNWGIVNSKGQTLLPCCFSRLGEMWSFEQWRHDFIEVILGDDNKNSTSAKIKIGVFSIEENHEKGSQIRLIIPIEYDKVEALFVDEHLKPQFIIATSSENDYVYDITGNFFFYYNNKHDEILNSYYLHNYKLHVLILHNKKYYISQNGIYFEYENCGIFKETENGELFLLGIQYKEKNRSNPYKQYSIENLDNIVGTKVEHIFLSYRFYELNKKLLVVHSNHQCGISDKNGKIIIPLLYKSIGYHKDNSYIASRFVSRDVVRYGIINDSGEELIPFIYNYLAAFNGVIIYSNNAIIKKTKDDYDCNYKNEDFDNDVLLGIMDSNYNIVSMPIYTRIDDANKYFIKVSKENNIGVINMQGKEIIELGKYDKIEFWGERLLKISKDEDFGVVNMQGKEIIELGTCDEIELMENGLIKHGMDFMNHYEWGVVNDIGEIIVPRNYSAIRYINNKYLMVCSIDRERIYDDYYNYRYDDMGLWGVIRNDGKIILDCSYDEYSVIYELNDKLKKNDFFSDKNITDIREENEEMNKYKQFGEYNGWDDDAINEAFEGDPEMTWNVE